MRSVALLHGVGGCRVFLLPVNGLGLLAFNGPGTMFSAVLSAWGARPTDRLPLPGGQGGLDDPPHHAERGLVTTGRGNVQLICGRPKRTSLAAGRNAPLEEPPFRGVARELERGLERATSLFRMAQT